MARETFAITSGQPFNTSANKVRNSVSGSWTSIASETPDRGVTISGVYWSCISNGATLKIRDRDGDEWYSYVCDGGIPSIDLLNVKLPLYTQFEYLDSTGSNDIIIYGTYIYCVRYFKIGKYNIQNGAS